MHQLVRFTAVVALAGLGLLLGGPAQADDDHAAFGQHVRLHAQGEMGLDGSHNPGMHQGRSSWDDHHTDPMAP